MIRKNGDEAVTPFGIEAFPKYIFVGYYERLRGEGQRLSPLHFAQHGLRAIIA